MTMDTDALREDVVELRGDMDEVRDLLESVTSFSTENLIKRQLAQLPTTGLRDGARAWATDGRKEGEGAGTGTGVPAYFNEATSTWKAFSDDADVVV